jgi:hypothetical protein
MPSGFSWLIFFAFLIDMYIPDPIPFADEIGLGALLLYNSKELAVLAIIIIGVLTFFGLPPVGVV